jgi:ABC-type sulfate transport system permease subunit
MAQAIVNLGPARNRTASARGGRFARVTLTLIAVAFLTLFVLVPAVSVFTQAFSKGVVAYKETFFPPEPANLSKLPFAERREINKKVQQGQKTWSAIRMTLVITAITVPMNAVFGVAAAWAITKFRFKGRAFLVSLIDLPFSVSPVVSGLVFVLILGREGFLQTWSQSTRLVWLSTGVRALPKILLASLAVAVLTFVVAAVVRQFLTPGPDARRRLRRVWRIGLRVATVLPLLILAHAYLWHRQPDWQWLGPVDWTWPDPSFAWRGFSAEHWWPIGMSVTWEEGVIFTPLATLLASLFVTFPFVARALIPLMESQGTDAEQAAASLGASGFTTFWRVTIPSIKWGLLYGVILCTARALGEFGAVSVVISGLQSKFTMPLRIHELWEGANTQAAFAVASLLALLAVVTLIIKTFAEWKAARDLRDVDTPDAPANDDAPATLPVPGGTAATPT